MRRRSFGCLGTVVLALVVLLVVLVVFVYSGLYNVGADYPDRAPVTWLLSNTADNSAKNHAKSVKAPPLDDPAMVKAGFSHYKDDCVICHGAPGQDAGELSRGLNPEPPKLTEAVSDWKPSELFWITKHGIRMTGMPAWGKIDKDEELWQTIAFVRRLPKMSPAEYKAFARSAPKETD